MSRTIPESDWKVFRRLADLALERFCARVLADISKIIEADNDQTSHERYQAIYGLIHERDKKLAMAFDDVSRSMAIQQLAVICRYQLLTDEEMSQFSGETRAAVSSLMSL